MVNTNQNIILQNFSKLLGLPNSDKRITFEMFARELSQRIELGDQLLVKSIGYFSIKKSKLVNADNQSVQNVLLFSTKEISTQNNDVLLFLMPEEQGPVLPLTDSYLNLSIDKPLIKILKDDGDFTSFPSGNELISLIESKIDKLFYECEIIRKSSKAEEEYTPNRFEIFNLENAQETGIDDHKTEGRIKTEDKLPLEDTSIPKESDKDAEGYEPIEQNDLINEEKLRAELLFDDFAIQQEIEAQDDNVETKENFSEAVQGKKDIPLLTDLEELKLLPRKKKKRKSRQLFYIVLGLIITAAVSLISYFNYDEISKIISKTFLEEKKTDLAIPKIEPSIVDRKNDPQWVISYPRVEKNIDQKNDSLIVAPSVFIKDKEEEIPQLLDTLSNSMQTENSSELQMVADNIYKLGEEYIVQVSSWKSKTKAEKESKKVQLKGYSVSIVEFNSASFGTVYRVRVGGFKSLNEANEFLTLNK